MAWRSGPRGNGLWQHPQQNRGPMVTDTINVNDPAVVAEITELAGEVTLREFQAADDYEHAELLEYYRMVRTLDDNELRGECGSTIHGSALVESFRGNWNGTHSKASACYHEAQRRLVDAGHSPWCQDSIYTDGYRDAVLGQGHTSLAAQHRRRCTCTERNA